MRRTTLAPASIAITIVLAAMLGGCAQTPSSNNSDRDNDKQEIEEVQEASTSDACLELADASTEVGGAITDASAMLVEDPATAAADITEATATFEAAVDDIDNEEVREAAAPITLGLTHFAEAIEGFAANPVPESLDPLTAASEEINDAFGAISDVCS